MADLTRNYNAVQNLQSLTTHLSSPSTLSMLRQMAISANDLSSIDQQIEAARILTSYLDPEMKDDGLYETIFSAWKGLIRKLYDAATPDKLQPYHLAGEMERGLYGIYTTILDNESPRRAALREFMDEIAAPFRVAQENFQYD